MSNVWINMLCIDNLYVTGIMQQNEQTNSNNSSVLFFRSD